MAKNSISKNILQNSIGTLFYLFCQWLTTVLIVKLVNYEAAGVLSLAMSVTTTFSTISLYGMRQFQISDYNNRFSSSQYVTSRYITSLLSFFLCLLFTIVEKYNNYQLLCINAFMLYKIAEALIDVYHGIDQKFWRFDIICNSFLLRGLLTLLAFTGMLLLTKNLLLSIFSMALVSYLCILLYDAPKSKHLEAIPFIVRDKATVRLLLECFPLVLVNFMSSIIILIPRSTLSLTFGDQQLGIYASVATPAVIVQVLASVIFNPLIPLFSQYDAENNIVEFKKLLSKTLIFIAGISLVSNVIALLLGKPLLTILFGNSIEPYVYLLLPIIWCTIFTAVVWLFMCILTALRKVKSLLISMIAGVVMCLLSSTIFIKDFNMNGVSYSILLSLGTQIVLMSIILIIYIKKGYTKKEIELGE